MPQKPQIIESKGIEYTLTRKRVKNINMRIAPDGTVSVSAPRLCPVERISHFVSDKADWIEKARARYAEKALETAMPCRFTHDEAMQIFTEISDIYYPLFAGLLGFEKPVIKVRLMKTRWGSCIPSKRQITFNQRLAEKPRAAIEYVVLHEYAHFAQCNHSPAFWGVVAAYMPDYKQRERLLK